MQSYEGQGTKRLCPGSAFVTSRYFHLYVMVVLSGARVVRVLLIFMAAPAAGRLCDARGVGPGVVGYYPL